MPPGTPRKGGGRRKAIIGAGAVVGIAALAGGAFAVYNVLLATGPQPAQALPDSTVAYLSIDLDPSGKQKLEALDTLQKFPGFEDNVDISSGDDLREKFFDMIQEQGECTNVSYADDIEPWLGDRLAVAGVDLGEKDDDGNDTVTPVVVVQVKDAAKANDGFQALSGCQSADSDDESTGSGSSDGLDDSGSSDGGTDESADDDFAGWAIRGDWAVLAETEDLATKVSDAAADSSLSDDDDFKKWTGEAGDDGILTAYVSPRVVDFVSQAVSTFSGTTCYAVSSSSDDFGSGSSDEFDQSCDDVDPTEADQFKELLADFDGLAVKVRFNDGAVEIESAGSSGSLGLNALAGGKGGDDALSTLPVDTAAAYGMGFEPGWFGDLTDYVKQLSPEMSSIDDALEQFEQESGLTLPDDVETLAGESAVISLGSDFDVNNTEEPSDVPFGVKIKGDPDAIGEVIDKLLANADVSDDVDEFVKRDSNGDFVAIAPSDDYRQQLLDDGKLGNSDTYRDVVPESDKAATVLYVNFDANDWLVRSLRDSEAPQDVIDNVEPLSALGISGWMDGDVSHALIRLTTN